ncbi:MAG: cyclic peptide export ABC transporter [Thermoanaerobaculia bacterium]|nr:cyclic peptide export ABC transporter [Thermoanaerobaculia bacterium]
MPFAKNPMGLVELLKRESTLAVRRLLVLALLAGASSATILAIVNHAASIAAPPRAEQEREGSEGPDAGGLPMSHPSGGQAEAGRSRSVASPTVLGPFGEAASGASAGSTGESEMDREAASLRLLALFVLAIAIYVVTQRKILVAGVSEIELVLHKIRVRIADKIRRADLEPLEKIGRSEIYSAVNKDTLTISQASMPLVTASQYLILIVFASMYLLWVSRVAFVFAAGFVALASAIHFKRGKALTAALHEATESENRLFDGLSSLLDGFPQVRIHGPRSQELYESVHGISEVTRGIKTEARSALANHFVFSQTSIYSLLGILVFLVPRFSDTYSDAIIDSTAAVLFLIGPIFGLLGTVPLYFEADAAAEHIAKLEASLDATFSSALETQEPLESFREISFDRVSFRYDDPRAETPFQIGPLDFTVRCGELLFVTGGNGSGKTTFIKVLTGLYLPRKGDIAIDGARVDDDRYEAYRALFTYVPAEAYLFDRLYGLPTPPADEFTALLRQVQLEGKTELEGDRFTTLDLSGGQRRRVALLVSLLEDRPIYVFDELAAHQDPAFRKKFYEELLPELKERGKAVVVVTHDDRYFDHADRTLKLEEGLITGDGAGLEER